MPTAITIRQIPGSPGSVYYPLNAITTPTPTPSSPTDLVIQLTAAALNHRDYFIRQHLYPGVAFDVPLLADGCGIVVAAGSSPEAQAWLNKRVIVNPGSGWVDHPDGPDDPRGYASLGGSKSNPRGTLAEYMAIDASEVVEAPAHLSSVEAAALPLTGLTAWRAVITKSGNAEKGRNFLITGIGGGVALMALTFLVELGANVYVSSGSQEKIDKAIKLGAKGGVNYKEKDWQKSLQAQLPKDRKRLDAIVDGAGGDIVEKGMRILKPGGVIVSYGMTLGPEIPISMGAVLRNIEFRGTTMGSRKEFREMVEFVRKHKLQPVVSRVVQGLDIEAIDGLFEDMKNGTQFGKLVVEIAKEANLSKL